MLQILQGVVDEADLEDTLHIEKNAENKRLNDEESDRFGEGSDSVVDKSTQKVCHNTLPAYSPTS